MADVITRFKLETTQYDSKLRDASKSLAEYTRQATLAGNEFGKFTQKNTETARALGTITPSANNAKDKVKELVGAFNDVAKAYNALTKEQQQSDFGKAMAESLSQLSTQSREAKQELYDMGDAVKTAGAGGGGLFSDLGDKMGGALQVFAGNMLTKAAGAVANLGSEMVGMVQQGVEMAKAGEGIRIAFERLGRGDILDGLREATHGTVNDLELMKQAVKFDNFNLSLEQMGTMLAFAQQQAKDTGQDVGYLVDSIVTGLGRKSLPILDNLGLSATEIRERMKETGDMTKAVADIIKERMAAAGGYVETASDRAAKATADLENAMTSLGETFAPLVGASDSLWNSIKIGAINALNTAVKPLIKALAEAGALGAGARSTAGFNNLGGNSKVDRMIGRLGNGKTAGAYSIYKQQLGEFDKYINNKRFQIAAYGGDNSSVAQSAKARLQTELDGALKMREEYVKRAQELHNKVPSPFEPATTSGGATGGGKGGVGGGRSTKTGPTMEGFQKDMAKWTSADLLKPEIKDNFVSVWAMMDEKSKEHMLNLNENVEDLGGALAKFGEKGVLEYIAKQMKKTTDAAKQQAMAFNIAMEGANGLGQALAGMEDPGAKAAGTVISAIANIVLGFATASAQASSMGPWGWIAFLAAGMAAAATVISTVHSLTGYAEGGMIKGNSYSGDRIGGLVDGSQLVGLNAGEVVLNAAQQNTLAQNLEGAGLQNLRLEGVISGEKIHIVHNRYLKRSGQGELVTW